MVDWGFNGYKYIVTQFAIALIMATSPFLYLEPRKDTKTTQLLMPCCVLLFRLGRAGPLHYQNHV